MSRKRTRRRVTVDTPWGETYRGTILRHTHDLFFEGKPERVYDIEDTHGKRHFARRSWIRGWA